MKISQDMNAQPDVKYNRPTHTDTPSFQKMVQSETHELKQQELKHLVHHLSIQGEKLARYRTMRELVKFKRMIKGFLEETVSSNYQLKHSHSIGFDGSSRKLTLLKELDEKMAELTEDVINQERKTVDILGLIGEIKGLLVNIYT
jgi:hypothetical protein